MYKGKAEKKKRGLQIDCLRSTMILLHTPDIGTLGIRFRIRHWRDRLKLADKETQTMRKQSQLGKIVIRGKKKCNARATSWADP